MADIVSRGWELVEAGDVPGAMRHLRAHLSSFDLAELGRLVGRLAAAAEFDDLTTAAAALAADPEQPQARYDFGYACIERGVPFLAVPVLRALHRQLPRDPNVYRELVAALEREFRHAEVVEVLQELEAALPDWPDRYLLANHALLAGELARARAVAARLSEPDDVAWRPAHRRLRRQLDRAQLAAGATPLDRRDLRGWHFVLTGGLLATLSPYGYDVMTGRYAFTQDSYSSCRYGLARLALALEAAGPRPRSVGLLPDRSSQVLGLAAAELFAIPAEPFRGPLPGQLVVAYQLDPVEQPVVAQLRERAPEQVLYEHATRWTDPPAVSADVSGRLVQVTTPPWGEILRAGPDRNVARQPADERPADQLAAEVSAAPSRPEVGDDTSPPDGDKLLTTFVTRVRDGWLSGPREPQRSPGPVPSNRFA